MKKQKLVIYPDTFLWIKGQNGLMYNTKHFSNFVFRITPGIYSICEKLQDYDNLYAIELDESLLNEEEKNFIEEIVSSNCGKQYPAGTDMVSFPPLLNIQKDINRLMPDQNSDTGEDILKYFTTLTIQAGGTYKNNGYYKQVMYPVFSREILTVTGILKILEDYNTPYLHNISIIIPNLNHYVKENNIPKELGEYKNISIYTTADKINSAIIEDLTDKEISIGLIYDSPYRLPDKQVRNIPGLYHKFLIRNRKDSELYLRYAKNIDRGQYDMVPVYDNNKEFFTEDVFLSEDDLFNSNLQKREIFMHQSVNPNFFGNLTIMPDGKIYSNVNTPALGTIGDSVYDIILKELTENYSWRSIRDKKPCKDCIWQWICPSPTNYEFVMGIESCSCTFNSSKT